MSNYTQTTNFTAKDALLSGNPAKLIKGADYDVEFAAIAAAIATKLDSSNAANPTASVGLTAVNGVAPTYIRSDGAPALSQAIVPTWTGIHTFSAKPAFNAGAAFTAGAGTTVSVSGTSGASNAAISYTNAPLFQSTSGVQALALNSVGTNFGLIQNDGSNLWSLATGTSLAALGTPILQWNATGTVKVLDDAGTLQTVGWRDMPLNNINTGTGYTLALSDRGKMIRVNGVAGQTVTIPANASVAFPDGATVVIVNNTAGVLSVAITSDALFLAGTGSSGTRSIATNGLCTLVKAYAATQWSSSGPGVS